METLALDKEKLNHIVALLSNIEYGSVSIIVHDGQITQIESTEKKRFAVEKKKKRQNENVPGSNNFISTNKRSL
ncbi:YezD family protein [Bacillus sp. T3]|uniref:YezD family protein n=1 Tax=Bacillus sp. T3 TaxID=467262 RepID=UPI002982341C|nr:YezD family protein [Bacillus sp. T3]